jgi:two-component system OmpR family response regulator
MKKSVKLNQSYIYDTNIQRTSLHEKKIKIFLVDDDIVFLKLLQQEFLQTQEYLVETYPTGEACLLHIAHNPDLIILDYHLDGIEVGAINGLETLDKIKTFNPKIPVVMLSSQDKIEVAVNCMHHQASDYVVKSETAFLRLQKTIKSILSYRKMALQLDWYMDRM